MAEFRRQRERDEEQEERRARRKLQRRPNPVMRVLGTKRAESFVGLLTEGAEAGAGGPVAEDEVPVVLRIAGKVYNRNMEKVDAERMVHAVWQAKSEFEGQYGRISLQDFLAVYLQRRHGTPRAASETAYNLLYTLGQHSYDPDW